jgi:hypothetical protein
MAAITNEKSLRTSLSGIIQSAGTIAGKLQVCIEFAGKHFVAHGDAIHFETIFDMVTTGNRNGRGKRVINLSTMKGYCAEAFALNIGANGDGVHKVRKDRTEGVEANSKLLSHQWNEYNKSVEDKPDFDIEKLKKYLKSKAEASKGVDADTMKMAALCLKAIVKEQSS